jgi:SRSO17 transposase
MAKNYLRGVVQATKCTYEGMASVVEGVNAQQFQHFGSESPWKDEPIIEKISTDANIILGNSLDSCLIIDETSFDKHGDCSVGVARQWCGRLGKVENCQVAVFAVLSNGQHHAMIDRRLYLPKEWIDNPKRCEDAGIPLSARELVSKSSLAFELIWMACARGVNFHWIGVDGGYGKEPKFLRELDDCDIKFVADIHRTQRIWLNDPCLHVPVVLKGRGKKPSKLRATTKPVTVDEFAKKLHKTDWIRCVLRDSTRGPLNVDIVSRQVWVWDGEERISRSWHLVIRREVKSPEKIKFSFSNAPENTPILRLGQMQGHRYWIERTFEDAKGACGLSDYQALGWRAWHHHVTMVMMAMLFIAKQRIANHKEIDLLSPRDIVEMLAQSLPHRLINKNDLIDDIARRHHRRQSAINSRFKSKSSQTPSSG